MAELFCKFRAAFKRVFLLAYLGVIVFAGGLMPTCLSIVRVCFSALIEPDRGRRLMNKITIFIQPNIDRAD